MTSEHFLAAPAILPSNAPPRPAPILADDNVVQAQASSYGHVSTAQSSLALHKSSYYHARSPQQNEQDFHVLWNRLYGCEKYIKYRKGYEGRDAKGEKVEKWPLEHEEAFFRGLLKYPPMGRKKLLPEPRGRRPLPDGVEPNKPLGRNELIALYINDWFGFYLKEEVVGRKKVSSHVQVLKAYFKKDPYVTWHLGVAKQPKRQPLRPTARMPFPEDFYEAPPSMALLLSAPTLLSNVPSNHKSQAVPRTCPVVLQANTSSMTIQDPKCRSTTINHNCRHTERGCNLETIHTITRSQRSIGITPERLADRQGWQDTLPQLAELDRKSKLNCAVLFAESSLAFAVDMVRNNCRLTIENLFRTGPGMAHLHSWQCATRIFEGSDCVEVLDDADSEVEPKQISPWDENDSMLAIKCDSYWWAKKIHALAERLRTAAHELPGVDKKDPVKKAQEEVRNAIKSITILQEIFIVDTANASQRNRVGVLYWKFRQTGPEEIGITTWRTLIPPGAEQQPAEDKQVTVVNRERANGLNFSLNMNDYQLSMPASLLGQPLGYHSAMRHNDHMLPIATSFNTSSYDFDALGGMQQEGQSDDGSDDTQTRPGSVPGQAFAFDNNISFMTSQDPLQTTAILTDGLNAYDPAVLDGCHELYWPQGQSDSSSNLLADQFFALPQGTLQSSARSTAGSQDILGSQYKHTRNQPSLTTLARQLGLPEPHQHIHHHTHYTAAFDNLLDTSGGIASWTAEQENQHPEMHVAKLQQQFRDSILHPQPRALHVKAPLSLLAPLAKHNAQEYTLASNTANQQHQVQDITDADVDWELLMASGEAGNAEHVQLPLPTDGVYDVHHDSQGMEDEAKDWEVVGSPNDEATKPVPKLLPSAMED